MPESRKTRRTHKSVLAPFHAVLSPLTRARSELLGSCRDLGKPACQYYVVYSPKWVSAVHIQDFEVS